MTNKEISVGIIVFVAYVSIVYATLGLTILLLLTFVFILSISAIKLWMKDSVFAKAGAVIVFNDVLFKLLMPAKYRKMINEIDSKRNMDKLDSTGNE